MPLSLESDSRQKTVRFYHGYQPWQTQKLEDRCVSKSSDSLRRNQPVVENLKICKPQRGMLHVMLKDDSETVDFVKKYQKQIRIECYAKNRV